MFIAFILAVSGERSNVRLVFVGRNFHAVDCIAMKKELEASDADAALVFFVYQSTIDFQHNSRL